MALKTFIKAAIKKGVKKPKAGPPTKKQVIQEKINKLKRKRSAAEAIKGRAAPSKAAHKSNAREANTKILFINKKIKKLEKQKKAIDKPKPKTKQILRRDRGNLKKGGVYQRQMQTQKFRSYKGIDAEIERLQKKKAKEGLTELEQNKLNDMIKRWKTKKEGGPIVKKTGGKITQKVIDQYNLLDNFEKWMKYESKKKKVSKKSIGGKVYKNTVARKHGGAIGTGAALRGFGKGYKKG